MSESPPSKPKGSAKPVESEVSALRSEVDQLRHQLDQLSKLQARSGQMSVKLLEALEVVQRRRVAAQNNAGDPEEIRSLIRETLREERDSGPTSPGPASPGPASLSPAPPGPASPVGATPAEVAPIQASRVESRAQMEEVEQSGGRRSLWINVGLVLIFIAVVAIGYPIVSPWVSQFMNTSGGLAGLAGQEPSSADASTASSGTANPETAETKAGNSETSEPEQTLAEADGEMKPNEMAAEKMDAENQSASEPDPENAQSVDSGLASEAPPADSPSESTERATSEPVNATSGGDTTASRAADSKLSLRTGRPLLIEPAQTAGAPATTTTPGTSSGPELGSDNEVAPESPSTEARAGTEEESGSASAPGSVVVAQTDQPRSESNDQASGAVSTETSEGGAAASERADVAEELLGAIDTTQSAPLEEKPAEDTSVSSPDLTLQQASTDQASTDSGATASSDSPSTPAQSPPPSTTEGSVPQRFAIEVGKEIQKNLKTLGFYVGSVDGLVGPNTISAIRNFKLSIGRDPASDLTPEEIAILAQTADRLRSN